jgi:hypothetical protein
MPILDSDRVQKMLVKVTGMLSHATIKAAADA